MTRRPSLLVRVLASALAAAALLTTAACSDDGDSSGAKASDAAASPLAEESRPASPLAAKTPSPSASARLTEAGAQAALITEGDIEDDWNQVKDAAKWGDTLLIGKVDVAALLTAKANGADCQKLLDALYDDDLLGKPSGASALTGFEQDDSRLLYQVAAYDHARLDASWAWLKTLPVKCDQFTAIDSKGGKRTVQVTQGSLPDVGDARQDLHVTVQGTSNGSPATLSLDVAVVRVGDDAITVTAGGLDGDEHQSTEQAVQKGTPRLKDVLSGKTPAAGPGRTG
ncbi:hypothetical protein [Streptomyces sp. NBC_00183]|uniref:hypothetical protein n=1 Tax=unclassified Streptomyces TaxID=2593676 RepID=UPI00225B3B71|nr:hypothetical protein [Streptomyces sp. NBC_00183]MCX5291280.1 hypothetical protein [Streptomyces sp. NBC_00183]